MESSFKQLYTYRSDIHMKLSDFVKGLDGVIYVYRFELDDFALVDTASILWHHFYK